MRFLTLVVLLAVSIAAAPVAAGSAQAPPNKPDPRIASGSLQRKLDDARQRWKAAHVRSYRFDIVQSCFCRPLTQRRVVVRRGVPTRYPQQLKSVATIPRLFGLVQSAIDDRAAKITATYGVGGVPREIYVDRVSAIADDEVGYTISRFVALT